MISAKDFWYFLMKRLAIVLLLVCVGCSAQSNNAAQPAATSPATGFAVPDSGPLSPELTERIQHQVRAQFDLPAEVTVTVSPVKPSDVAGFEALTLTLGGHGKEQKVDFLLSKDGKTLARMTKIDLTRDIYAERMGKIDVQGRPVRGNPDAKVTIVNYDDYQCPFCSRMHTTLTQEILPQYGDKVKIIYKDYPLPMHPWAKHAANDANCLAKESPKAFWDFADYVHAHQREISPDKDINKSFAELDRIAMDMGQKNGANVQQLQACIKNQSDDSLKASMKEAESMGVQATPTMFINGERLEGAVEPDEVRAVINGQLKAAGIQPPPDPKTAAAPAPAK